MGNNVCLISVDKIIPNISQPRKYFDEAALEDLAQSIKNYGVIQPISVRKIENDIFELIAGERRYRASKLAGLTEVPAIIIEMNNEDSAFVALLENIQREDLNFIEEAEAYQNLIKQYDYTQAQLAEMVGKKQSTIANKLRVLKLGEAIRRSLLENNLTERHGRALLKLPNEELQLKVLEKVIEKELNVKKTEELVDKELFLLENAEIAADGKKKIKGIFAPKVYINTIKQVFDKYGISANYKSKELEDSIKVTITIPKK